MYRIQRVVKVVDVGGRMTDITNACGRHQSREKNQWTVRECRTRYELLVNLLKLQFIDYSCVLRFNRYIVYGANDAENAPESTSKQYVDLHYACVNAFWWHTGKTLERRPLSQPCLNYAFMMQKAASCLTRSSQHIIWLHVLLDLWHASQADTRSSNAQVTLEPSSYTQEKFALYKKYQENVHNDPRESPQGFKRFLVTSPLRVCDFVI